MRVATSGAFRLPGFDLAGEFLVRHGAASVDIQQTLLNLIEYVEPIDDLIKGHIIGQALDGVDGVLLRGVGVRGSVLFRQLGRCRDRLSHDVRNNFSILAVLATRLCRFWTQGG